MLNRFSSQSFLSKFFQKEYPPNISKFSTINVFQKGGNKQEILYNDPSVESKKIENKISINAIYVVDGLRRFVNSMTFSGVTFDVRNLETNTVNYYFHFMLASSLNDNIKYVSFKGDELNTGLLKI